MSQSKQSRVVRWLALAGTALVLSACGGTPDAGEAPAEERRTVTAASGEVEIPANPERVVALWQPTVAALLQLGVTPVGALGDPEDPDTLEGYLPEGTDAGGIEIVASPAELQIEQVVELAPDLIIGADVESIAQHQAELEQLAPTVLLPWEGTGSWRDHLTDVAATLGLEQEAGTIVSRYETRVDEVREAIGGDVTDLEVSVIRLQNAEELRLETPASFPGQVVADVGLSRPDPQLEADPDRDYLSIRHERLREGDGDAVFVLPNDSEGQGGAALDALEGNPLYPQLQAVREGRVFVVDYTYWGASTYVGAHRILDDLEKSLGQA